MLWSISITTIVGLAVVMGWGGYLAYFEPPWLGYPLLPLQTAGHRFHAGDIVPVWIVRSNSDKTARVYAIARTLHCDTATVPALLEPSVSQALPGIPPPVLSLINKLPLRIALEPYGPLVKVPAGSECFIVGDSDIEGRIRRIPVRWYTEKFIIVADEEPL